MNTEDTQRLGLPSASAFERLAYCPGSKALENTLPDVDTSDEDSQRGSRIHQAFQDGNTLMLSEEEEEAYKAGVKFTESLIAQWAQDFGLTNITEGPREERIWYNHPEDMSPLCSAQLDRHYISGTYSHICDLKSGFANHVPPATKSWQLRLQAILLWKEHPELTHIRVSYARALSKVGNQDWCDYILTDLENSERSLLQHLWEASLADAQRHPGHWCRYCKAMLSGACLEASAHALLPSVIAKNAMPAGDFDVDLAVAQMQPVDLVRVWQSSSLIKGILASVQSRLKAMSDEDLTALGITRGKGRENHNITNIAQSFDWLTQQGWTHEEIFTCMEFSNTKLAKQLRVDKGLPSEKAATLFLKQQLAQFITVSETEKPLKEIKE